MEQRILFITDRFPPQVGGVGVSAHRLASALAAHGHAVQVLHLSSDTEPGAVVCDTDGALTVYRLGVLVASDLTQQLAEMVISNLHAREHFDLIHGHYLVPAGYLAAFCARRFGIASYVSVRGNDVDRGIYRPDQFPFVLWTLQHAGGVGCVSTELAEKCRVLTGRTDIHFTPNTVDTTLFRPQPKDKELLQAIHAQPEEVILGFVGELRFKKGTHFVYEAFRTVRAQRPARLLLVGGMRHEDKTLLRRYLRQHPELRDGIEVVEYVHDRETLVRYYNLMDIVLSPSLWDGMPNSVLEAMACGRPVLASNAGGIRDLITHGDTGVLIDTDALDRLGEGCLEMLAAGSDFLTTLGTHARAHVLTQHSPDREITQLLELYDRVR